jgi:hypothetical protein
LAEDQSAITLIANPTEAKKTRKKKKVKLIKNAVEVSELQSEEPEVYRPELISLEKADFDAHIDPKFEKPEER